MPEFIENIYVYLWAVLALLTAIIGIRLKKVYPFIASALFVFMTVWYGLRTFGGYDMFSGVAVIIFRVVCLVFLALCVGFYLINRNKSGK